MDEHSRNFFTLLRFVLGNVSTGCPVLTLPEWQGVYDVCQRQGLLPFVGHALSNTSCMLKNDSDKVGQSLRGSLCAGWQRRCNVRTSTGT